METTEKVESKMATPLEEKPMDEILLKGKGFNLIPYRFYKKLKSKERAVDLNTYSVTMVVLFIALTLGLIVWRYLLKLEMLPLAEKVVDKMNKVSSFSAVESKARGIEIRLDTLETIELSSYDIVSLINDLTTTTDVPYTLSTIEAKDKVKVTVSVDSVDKAASFMADVENNPRFKNVTFLALEIQKGGKNGGYLLTFEFGLTQT